VNVGGHRTFRPKAPAERLKAFDVVNIGAAGTFVVRRPGSRAKFRSALTRHLPFDAHVALCDGRDLLRLESDHPFEGEAPSDVTRFLSVFCEPRRSRDSLAIRLPTEGEWLVRVVAAEKQFVFGEYRRHMKTIGYLGQLDGLFGVPATTRNWNTIGAIIRVLRGS